MAAANSNIQVTSLDFGFIKNNLKTFLQSQDTLKDYNFDGSALSVLLDVLAYNTQYNAYYLNMIANEMFLDTAIMRQSVISRAKLLGYTPKSAVAPTAFINLKVNQVTDSSLTVPAGTKFLSEAIDGVNYSFVTTDSYTVNTSNNTAYFTNIEIKQGTPSRQVFTYNSTSNPSSTFALTDIGIDTTSLKVTVQQSSSNTSYEVYTLATDYLTISTTSTVYFLQESISKPGTYEIYFGDGILGQSLTDGNIVTVSYILTKGTSAAGANNFVLKTPIAGYANTVIYSVTPATAGANLESISSIKFQAPKSFSAQNRAVTKDDYITLIQQNKLGYAFDAVNVWGGEENTPPQYGRIYVSIKPSGSYSLTTAQKQNIINNVILPSSVLTVTPVIVDPDYVYMLLNANILYDSKKTNLTSTQLQSIVNTGIINYCNTHLNTFNSTFVVGDLIQYIQSLNQSIVAADFDVFLQKRLIPTLNSIQTYTVNFGNTLEQSIVANKSLQISPSFAQYDSAGNYYSEVYFEPTPDSTTNIDSVTVVSGGSSYSNPVVTILGDGSGATATATVQNGVITAINIISGGLGYTQAIITINDPTGSGATATAVIRGNYGTLSTYYYNNGIKNILTGSSVSHQNYAGTADYAAGTITLTNFTPSAINSTTGILKITAYAANRIVSSSYNQIITLDNQDPAAVTVNMTAM